MYLNGHIFRLLLHLLNDLISCAAVVTSCRGTVLFPLFQTDPTEIILALYTDTFLINNTYIETNHWSTFIMSLANAYSSLAGSTLGVVGFWQQGLSVLLGNNLSLFILYLLSASICNVFPCLVTLLQDYQDWINSNAFLPKAHTHFLFFNQRDLSRFSHQLFF